MLPAGERGVEAPPANPNRLRDAIRRPRGILTIALIVVVLVVSLLATVPVPQTSSFSFSGGNPFPPSYFDARYFQSLCPAGAKVVVAFSSTGLNLLTFTIVAPNDTWSWSQQSAFANASFVVPTCGTYLIFVVGFGVGSYSINGTLSYSAPLL